MAGAFFQAPELTLTPGEAKAMAEAAAQVASHYDHAINPKLMSWVNLAMVCGGIYGTRAMAIRQRVKDRGGKGGPQIVKDKPAHVNGAAAAVPRTPSELFGLDFGAGNTLQGE